MKTFLRASVIGTALAFALSTAAVTQEPSPEKLKQHETTPGGQYQPSLDLPAGAPGAKPGAPALTAEQFNQANRI